MSEFAQQFEDTREINAHYNRQNHGSWTKYKLNHLEKNC